MPGAPLFLDSKQKQGLRRRLTNWYRRNGRALPWRRTRDPFCVWVSEVMLQQTQVATVVPYYERFIARFPTIDALAAAAEEDVLRLWEGLGYYRRARQLHRAARQLVDEHGGRFPRHQDAVRRLPGIGRYTAGAILSIAFDARQPILEANTRRLLARLSGTRGDLSGGAGEKRLWALAEDLLPGRHAGNFNQALMELGSRVCTPRDPSCDTCPLAVWCVASRQGLQGVIPPATRKVRFENVTEAAVVVRHRGRILLRRYGDGERWAGLWDFPRFRLAGANGSSPPKQLVAGVRKLTGIVVEPVSCLATMRHGVTRFRITLHCHAARYRCGRLRTSPASPCKWVPPVELDRYALPATGRRICRLIAADRAPDSDAGDRNTSAV